MMGLFWINLDLYRFFRKQRGLGFAARVIPWHWTYFFYSGLAFAIGTARHQVNRFRGLRQSQ
jgi:hypothetical protein